MTVYNEIINHIKLLHETYHKTNEKVNSVKNEREIVEKTYREIANLVKKGLGLYHELEHISDREKEISAEIFNHVNKELTPPVNLKEYYEFFMSLTSPFNIVKIDLDYHGTNDTPTDSRKLIDELEKSRNWPNEKVVVKICEILYKFLDVLKLKNKPTFESFYNKLMNDPYKKSFFIHLATKYVSNEYHTNEEKVRTAIKLYLKLVTIELEKTENEELKSALQYGKVWVDFSTPYSEYDKAIYTINIHITLQHNYLNWEKNIEKNPYTITEKMLSVARDNKIMGFVEINPTDFLMLTTRDWIEEQAHKETSKTYKEYERFGLEGEICVYPFLEIDRDSGYIYGHEGRHRAIAAREAREKFIVGIKLSDSERNDKIEDIPKVWIGQYNMSVKFPFKRIADTFTALK